MLIKSGAPAPASVQDQNQELVLGRAKKPQEQQRLFLRRILFVYLFMGRNAKLKMYA